MENNLQSVSLEVEYNENVRIFTDFLDSKTVYPDGVRYSTKLQDLLAYDETRLIVNINHLRAFNLEFTKQILLRPTTVIPACEEALTSILISLEPTLALPESELSTGKKVFSIGFEGSFGDALRTPRTLSSEILGTLVCLQGIVTSASLVRPKLLKSVHYCEANSRFHYQEYRDSTMNGPSLASMPTTTNTYPTEDEEGNKLSTEYGLSTYRLHQSLSVQEMPESAPPGQLPRSVDVLLDNDLVDRAKPGDRVSIVGIFKSLSSFSSSQAPSSFRTVLIANFLKHLSSESSTPIISPSDLADISQISSREDVFELLAASIAPSVHGHEAVKKAILLMLLGGVEKNLSNGTHLRGDINILLVGDPSTAKSQMLRFVLNIAPLAVATTGRGSSGVGLTAAVTTDKETGERRLEAGAMVLADRGVVCIDEFDKMSDADRVAIHEVMEQQTVTIAKAGIMTSLNARCSVMAAANPIWGQYRESASPQENIRLPDSLLSRFDLLFVILDKASPENDRRISRHVLSSHRYIPPGSEEGVPYRESDLFSHCITQKELEQISGDSMGGSASSSSSIFQHYVDPDGNVKTLLTLEFIKKYISLAKSRVTPILSKTAAQSIVAGYTEFRQKATGSFNENGEAKTLPVTPRTLETLIRLATAHAKARHSNRVEKKDAIVAKDLMRCCLYKEVLKKKTRPSVTQKKAQKRVEDDSESDSNEDDDESNISSSSDEETIVRRTRRVQRKTGIVEKGLNSLSLSSKLVKETDEFDFTDEPSSSTISGNSGNVVSLTPEEALVIKNAVAKSQKKFAMELCCTIDDLMNELPANISKEQVEFLLNELQESNQLMYLTFFRGCPSIMWENNIRSFVELNEMAKVTVDTNKPLRLYLKSAEALFKQATVYLNESSLEKAYVLYLKYSNLILTELPTHPEYDHNASFFTLKNKCAEALEKLETIKPILSNVFEERKKRAQIAEKERQEKLDKETEAIQKKTLMESKLEERDRKIIESEKEKLNIDKGSHESPTKTIDHSKLPPSLDITTSPQYPAFTLKDGTVLKPVIISSKVIDKFLALAHENTRKGIETCGHLTGIERNDCYFVTTVLLPKQVGTPDTTSALDEEEIFIHQITYGLLTLGWIHTHPTQSCFLSSVDLHMQYSFQATLPEAVALVVSPTMQTYGAFRLTLPDGMDIIRSCKNEKKFHPHQTTTQNAIYQDITKNGHVHFVDDLNIEMIDFRISDKISHMKKPSSEIDEIFSSSSTSKAIKKKAAHVKINSDKTSKKSCSSKKSADPKNDLMKQSEEDLAFADSRGLKKKTRATTEEGFPIYSMEELHCGKGGDTENCPFDCDCCY